MDVCGSHAVVHEKVWLHMFTQIIFNGKSVEIIVSLTSEEPEIAQNTLIWTQGACNPCSNLSLVHMIDCTH